ncbi:MAG: hypothetical protein ACLRQF_12635 [Thomasclavelia ramosa]
MISSPIQEQAIPAIISGRDILDVPRLEQENSSFALPILQKLYLRDESESIHELLKH